MALLHESKFGRDLPFLQKLGNFFGVLQQNIRDFSSFSVDSLNKIFKYCISLPYQDPTAFFTILSRHVAALLAAFKIDVSSGSEFVDFLD